MDYIHSAKEKESMNFEEFVKDLLKKYYIIPISKIENKRKEFANDTHICKKDVCPDCLEIVGKLTFINWIYLNVAKYAELHDW